MKRHSRTTSGHGTGSDKMAAWVFTWRAGLGSSVACWGRTVATRSVGKASCERAFGVLGDVLCMAASPGRQSCRTRHEIPVQSRSSPHHHHVVACAVHVLRRQGSSWIELSLAHFTLVLGRIKRGRKCLQPIKAPTSNRLRPPDRLKESQLEYRVPVECLQLPCMPQRRSSTSST